MEVFFVLFLGVLLLFMMLLVSLWVELNSATVSAYECGFDPKGVTRSVFSYRFFLIAILFLIFDVEVSLLLPLPFVMMSVYSYVGAFFFVGALLAGLLYEVSLGSLEWL